MILKCFKSVYHFVGHSKIELVSMYTYLSVSDNFLIIICCYIHFFTYRYYLVDIYTFWSLSDKLLFAIITFSSISKY